MPPLSVSEARIQMRVRCEDCKWAGYRKALPFYMGPNVGWYYLKPCPWCGGCVR